MNDKPEKIDLFCPSCSVYVEANVVAWHCYETSVIQEDFYAPEDSQYTEAVFTLAACIKCEKPLLARQDFQVLEGIAHPQNEVVRVYPLGETALESVPEVVARPYREAHRACQVKLYDSCTVMCRKCVEAVCWEYEERSGPLAHRLESLLKKGVIDNALFEWTKELRLSGNEGAHIDPTREITESDAKAALEFAKAVLVYAFELPQRLQAARRRRISCKGGEL